MGWIAKGKCLPNLGERHMVVVIAYSLAGGVFPCFFRYMQGEPIWLTHGTIHKDITHWMPLPPPPADPKQEDKP